jgi:hypothetical protein
VDVSEVGGKGFMVCMPFDLEETLWASATRVEVDLAESSFCLSMLPVRFNKLKGMLIEGREGEFSLVCAVFILFLK